MKRKPKTNTYDPSIPASPENPRSVTREMIFALEHWHPEMRGVGRSMIKRGIWVIPTPLSPVDQIYPDPLTQDMVKPFKIPRSLLNQLIERDPVYKDLEIQNVSNRSWEIIEDLDETPESDE